MWSVKLSVVGGDVIGNAPATKREIEVEGKYYDLKVWMVCDVNIHDLILLLGLPGI